MVFDNMFYQNEIIGTALNAASVRSNVINNNIANADVPGFKKSAVQFESILESELRTAKQTGEFNANRVKPIVNYTMQNFNYRLDENNVDVELEMVELYKNASRYDVMANSLINNYRRINLVLKPI